MRTVLQRVFEQHKRVPYKYLGLLATLSVARCAFKNKLRCFRINVRSRAVVSVNRLCREITKLVKRIGAESNWGVQKTTTQKTKTYDLENDDLENNDLENDDLKKTAGSGGRLIEVCEMPHPRTKPKQHIHSKSQCNLIKRAKHPRKSLIAASYPGLVISNAKVKRSNLHVQHTFLHIVVRADDSLRTKISWMHFGRFPFTQNLRNFGNSGNWYSIFPEKFPDFRKRFRLRTIQPEILDIREQI